MLAHAMGDPRLNAANNDDDESSKRLSPCLEIKPFPQKLMDILDDESSSSIIGWLPHGRSFCVYRRHEFETVVLPRFFSKPPKYASFVRKLHRWGFVREARHAFNVASYGHEKFRRGDRRLLLGITCCSHPSQRRRLEERSRSSASTTPLPISHTHLLPGSIDDTNYHRSFDHAQLERMSDTSMHSQYRLQSSQQPQTIRPPPMMQQVPPALWEQTRPIPYSSSYENPAIYHPTGTTGSWHSYNPHESQYRTWTDPAFHPPLPEMRHSPYSAFYPPSSPIDNSDHVNHHNPQE